MANAGIMTPTKQNDLSSKQLQDVATDIIAKQNEPYEYTAKELASIRQLASMSVMLQSDSDIRSTINRMMPNASDKIKVGVAVVLENLQGKSLSNDDHNADQTSAFYV